MGPIFNCSSVTKTHTYLYPKTNECKGFAKSGGTKQYLAEVYQYHPTRIRLQMYLCYAEHVSLRCKENWLTNKDRSASKREVKVKPAECLQAKRTMLTGFGKLVNVGVGKYRTRNKKSYYCTWASTHYVEYTQFWVEEWSGYIHGLDTLIHQTVTHSKCKVVPGENQGSCVMSENPNKALVWEKIPGTPSTYRSLGNATIDQVGEMESRRGYYGRGRRHIVVGQWLLDRQKQHTCK